MPIKAANEDTLAAVVFPAEGQAGAVDRPSVRYVRPHPRRGPAAVVNEPGPEGIQPPLPGRRDRGGALGQEVGLFARAARLGCLRDFFGTALPVASCRTHSRTGPLGSRLNSRVRLLLMECQSLLSCAADGPPAPRQRYRPNSMSPTGSADTAAKRRLS